MKLHLPGGLRAALMACFAVVSGFATTLSTATITGGVMAISFSAQVEAVENLEVPEDRILQWGQNYNLTTALNGESIVLETHSVWDSAPTTHYHGLYVEGEDTVVELGAVNLYVRWPDLLTAKQDRLPRYLEYTKLGSGTLVVSERPTTIDYDSGPYDWWISNSSVLDGEGRPNNIHVNEGTLEIAYNGGDTGRGFVATNAIVAAGATLRLSAENALGTNSDTCKGIILNGEEGKNAALELKADTGIYNTLSLNGYSDVIGRFSDGAEGERVYTLTVGGENTKISSNGVANTISANLRLSEGLTLDVMGTQGALNISGVLSDSGTLTKTGVGTLTLSGGTNAQSSSLSGGLVVEAGLLVNSGYLTIGGIVNLTSAIENTGTIIFAEDARLSAAPTTVEIDENGQAQLKVTIATGSGEVIGATNLVDWTTSTYADGVLSYAVRAITRSGGAFVWDGTGEDFKVGTTSVSFQTNDYVVFRGTEENVATLGANLSAALVQVDEGSSLVIKQNGYTLETGTFTLNGTLHVTEALKKLVVANWTCGEKGELLVDSGLELSSRYDDSTYGLTENFNGTLHIANGIVWQKSLPKYGNVLVDAGSVFDINGYDYAGSLTIAGNGASSKYGALVLENSTVSGKVTVSANDKVSSGGVDIPGASIYVWNEGESRQGTLSGEVVLDGTLIKRGSDGTLILSGEIQGDGGIKLEEGHMNISGRVVGDSAIEAASAGVLTISGTMEGKGELFVTKGTMNISGKVTGESDISSRGGALTISGEVTGGGAISAQDGALTISGKVTGGNAISADGGSLNISGVVSGAGDVSVDGGALTVETAGRVESEGSFIVTSGSALVNGTLAVKKLEINSGSVNVKAALDGAWADISGTADIVLNAGGSLTMMGEALLNNTGTVTLAGGSLALCNGVHTADIVLDVASTIKASSGADISGSITQGANGGNLTMVATDTTQGFKTAVYLSGSVNLGVTNSLIIEEGRVSWGNKWDASSGNDIIAKEIVVKEGAVFEINRDGSYDDRFKNLNVRMEGGLFEAFSSRFYQPETLHLGSLILEQDSRMNYGIRGNMAFTSLTGKGNLDITTSTEVNRTQFDEVKDYSGVLSIGEGAVVSMGRVNQTGGLTATIIGSISSADFAKKGAGTLEVSALTLTGRVEMNYEGVFKGVAMVDVDGTLTKTEVALSDVLTLQAGCTLVYSSATGTQGLIRLDVDNFQYTDEDNNVVQKQMIVDLSALSYEELRNGVDSGIYGISAEDAANYIVVDKQYIIEDGGDESLVFRWVGEGASVTWDENWGITQAPGTTYTESSLDSSISLIGTQYNNTTTGLTVIEVTGTAEGAAFSVYGMASGYAAVTNLPGGSWIKVSGGTLDIVAGGSSEAYCISYSGDSHISVENTATVNYIMGGHAHDSWQFYGDTYISIFSPNVLGSVLGGSVQAFPAGYFTQNGDTHIFVYTPLESNSGGTLSVYDRISVEPNAIIGAHASLEGNHALLSFEGESNIVVDLSTNGGNEAQFVKKLIGSTYLWTHLAAENKTSTVTHTGDANITVRGAEGVTFTDVIVGASFLAPGYNGELRNTAYNRMGGKTQISLSGGTYQSMVMGGSYIYGTGIASQGYAGIGHDIIQGGTNLILDGTFEDTVVGGSVVAANDSSSTLGMEGNGAPAYSTQLTLNGGNYADVVGGSLLIGSGASATLHNGSKVTMTDGCVDGILVGGCWVSSAAVTVAEGEEPAAIVQGNILVSLQGGTLSGDVYAAGMQRTTDDAIAMTTASTMVEIASGVVFNGEQLLSGGYNEGAVNALVSGSKTLSFTSAGDYANLGGVLFRDFDTVEVAKGASVELKGAHGITTQSFEMLLGSNGGVLTKKGEGTFIMGSNMEGATVSVQEGTLKMNTSLTAIEVGASGRLDATAAGIGANALTLKETATIALDGSTGLALGSADAAGALTLDKSTRLTLDVANVADAERIVLFTGLSAETISGMAFTTSDDGVVYAMLSSYVANYSDFLGGNGVLILESDGSLVISAQENISTNWTWKNPAGGIWKDDTPEPGDWTQVSSPAGAPVVFSDTGMGTGADATTTITIEGDVTPASVLVKATYGTYVFTSLDTTPGSITGVATLTKEGAGTLRIENANSFSGGVILTAGVLEVANTEGLGKGVTRFNGGTLAYDLDAVHTVTGDELALFEGYTGAVNVALVGGPTDAAENITWDFSGGESTAVLENDLKASGEGVLTLALADGSTVGTNLGLDIADAATAANGTTPATVGTTVKLAGEDITFAYELTGQGTLDVSGTTGTSTLSGDNSAFEGSIKASSGAGKITNFASNKASGGEKTTLILSDSTVELASGVTDIEAGTVQLIGDNTLNTAADFTGTVMVDGGSGAITTPEGTTFTNIQLVNGGNMSVVGDLEVKGSITSGGEGYEAGGNLTVGGKGVLTIGSVKADGTRTDSRVAVGGELSGVTRINIVGNLGPLPRTTDALITADSFAAVDKKLTVAFESEVQVSYINMSIGETYTLLSTTQTLAAFDSLTLQAGATTADTESAGVLVNGMKYSLVAGANSIVLKASFNGLEWTSTDGKWDAAEDWNGTLPTAASDLGLVGGGTAEVAVADALQANSLRVDTAGAQGANAVTAYTLSGSGSLSMDGALLVSSGSLTVDALSVKSSERTVIGSLTRPEQKATLSVGAAALSTLPTDLNAATAADEFAKVGKLETGSLTLQSAAGSFTNNGLTSVTGALITELADGQRLGLTNNGMLQMGDKSNVGTITGNGVVWATGGTVTVAALDGAALAKASGGATLSVGSVNNALGFSLVDDTSSISILAGDVKATSLNSNGGLLNIAGKLTLVSTTSSGGRVKAESVDMASAAGSTLTSLQTGSLTLNLNTLAVGSPLLTLTDNVRNALGEAQTSIIKLTLTGAVAADGVAGMELSTFTYDNQSNLGTRCNEQATLSDGSTYLREWTEYTLVDVTAANSLYSWDLSGTELAELQQRFAEENGSYAQLTATDGGDIVLKVYKDDLREWNGGDVFDAIDKTVPAESASRWAGTITNAGGEVLDLS